MSRRLRFLLAVLVATSLATGPAGLAGQTGPVPSAAISGVVVDASSGQPLRKVIVTLADAGRDQARLLTDDRGRFLFRGLPPGERYTLLAAKLGYVNGQHGGRYGRNPRPVVLTAGQWFPEARIELVRFGSISGIVVDEASEPVVGAFVRVLTQMWISGRQQWTMGDPVRTDDLGRYRFSNLAAGRYVVSVPSAQNALPAEPGNDPGITRALNDGQVVDSPSSARLVVGSFPTPPPPANDAPSLAYPTTYFPATTVMAQAQVVTLGEAQDRGGVNIEIRPVPTWRVSGRLSDPSGPGAGLPLRLMAPGTETFGYGSETATTFADRQGRFTFLNVPEGRYTIDARRSFLEIRYEPDRAIFGQPLPLPGLSDGRGGAGEIVAGPKDTVYFYGANGERAAWGRLEVDVPKSQVSDLILEIHPGITLEGRMIWEQQGRLEPKGNPVIAVLAEPVGPASLGMPSGEAQDGPTTTFSVSGLLPGQYLLRPFGGGQLKSIIWNGTDYTYSPFDASAGQDFNDIVVTFTDQTSSIAGTVSSVGPEGAAVLVFPTARDRWTQMGFRPLQFQSVAVSTDGRYSIEIPEGEYYLIAVDARDAEAWHDPGYLEKAAGLAARAAVSWGGARAVNLNLSEVR